MTEDKQLDTQFWLVIMPDASDEPPKCIACDDQASFEDVLRQHILDADGELYAFAFKGNRIPIGNLQPIGAYILDGKTVQISKNTTAIDPSGRIYPLVQRPRTK